jgi:ornithine cyclodeaminase/alanine dehydrogenase-like protein (mu-crystallin family)
MDSGQRLGTTGTVVDSRPFHILDACATERVLPIEPLIAALAATLEAEVYAPTRSSFDTPAAQWLVMPAADDEGAICKVVRVGRAGSAAKLAGAALMLDATGAPEAVVDGAVLTARRTAAMTAYATDLLARDGAATLALFGAGALALPHVAAINAVRPLTEIRVVARTPHSARALAATLATLGWNARPATASEAVRGVDIITTVTTAQAPVFAAADVSAGTHINAVGAHRAHSREIPAPVFSRLRGILVDSPETAWTEAGDLILAREEGYITDAHLIVDVRNATAASALRQDAADVTLFKSVGHAVADLAAGRLIRRMLVGGSLPV